MAYEFFAILKDGTEHSIVGDNEEQVSKAGQEWLAENFFNFAKSTFYLPHENAEASKQRMRDEFKAKKK